MPIFCESEISIWVQLDLRELIRSLNQAIVSGTFRLFDSRSIHHLLSRLSTKWDGNQLKFIDVSDYSMTHKR